MLAFELTAIDLILVIAVIVLLILYMTKMQGKNHEQTSLTQQTTKSTNQKKTILTFRSDYTECPRGLGNIKKIGDDNSVSERCLGCHMIMNCYSDKEVVED